MKQVQLLFPGHIPAFYTQLSALSFVGGDLWVAADEGHGIARLQTRNRGKTWKADPVSSLTEVLDLPGKKELDLEGMDWDAESGHLWLVGSHSLGRKKAVKEEGAPPKLSRLAEVEPDKNRYLLARVPLLNERGASRLLAKSEFTDEQFSAQLECQKPEAFRNALYDALREDPHFGRFVRREIVKDDGGEFELKGIPGKDNGLNIEGLAFGGTTSQGAARLFLGLRGPVLRGWAAILEVHVTARRGGGKNAGRLHLSVAGEDGRPHRRIFLQLDGLGIRDLCFRGDDLLILAGPSLMLDWSVTIYRWVGAKCPVTTDEIFDQAPGQLEALPLPLGQMIPGEKGNRAEGMALFPPGSQDDVLILYDTPGPSHLPKKETVIGDIFPLNLPPP